MLFPFQFPWSTEMLKYQKKFGFFMETQEQKIIPHPPSNNNSLTSITTSLGLGLGLGFGFLYFMTPKTLKPISSTIKAADGALKSTKALQKLTSPSLSSFLFFSKTLINVSYKASKHLNFTKTSSQNLAVVTKRLKAYVAALNLVRYLHFPPVVGNGFLGLGVLSIGYKLSKNLLRVLEGFVGIQMNSTFRTGFEAVELFVKTAVVTREFSRITSWAGSKMRFEIEGDSKTASKPAYVFVRTDDFKLRVCLNYRRIYRFDCCRYDDCSNFGRSNLDYPFCEKVLIVEESLQTCLSELLCLALPVYEQIQPILL